jgi:hypothetical protein
MLPPAHMGPRIQRDARWLSMMLPRLSARPVEASVLCSASDRIARASGACRARALRRTSWAKTEEKALICRSRRRGPARSLAECRADPLALRYEVITLREPFAVTSFFGRLPGGEPVFAKLIQLATDVSEAPFHCMHSRDGHRTYSMEIPAFTPNRLRHPFDQTRQPRS